MHKVNGGSQRKPKKENLPEEPQRIANQHGTACWRLRDKLHRLDGPAVEWVTGDKHWYQHGKRHRIDGPAVERADGRKEWWVNGKRHRLDGPAIERACGCEEWLVDSVKTSFPELCEKALLPSLTHEEFYELCVHEDYVVRQLAAHNPNCPPEISQLVSKPSIT